MRRCSTTRTSTTWSTCCASGRRRRSSPATAKVPGRSVGFGERKGLGPRAEVLDVDAEPVTEARRAPSITIAFAPVKGDRPEWVVQKLTELGVDRIVPIRSARSVVRWEGGRAARALDRLGRVAREAAAQSRRTWLPAVEPLTPLEGLAELVGVAPVLAVPGGGPLTLDHRLVVVGPEGGWDDTELTRFGEGIGLGPTVLRSETAALVAATFLCGLRSNLVRPLA